jgi:hypothetical protein
MYDSSFETHELLDVLQSFSAAAGLPRAEQDNEADR